MINRFHTLRKSFTFKVISILVVTMICMAALFDFWLISMQKKTYQALQGSHGVSNVRMLAHTVRLAVFVENEAEMLAPVEGVMLQDDVVEVLILAEDGRVLLHKSKEPADTLRLRADSKEVRDVLSSLEESEQLSRQTSEHFIYWSQVSLSSSSNIEENWYFEDESGEATREVIGYVAVVLSKKFFKQGVHSILVQTGLSVLVFLFIGVLVTFFIIKRVTAPLRKLMLLMRKSTGNTAVADDLVLITETYGSMIEDLQKSFTTITELKEGLEEKVKDRTAMLALANTELSRRQEKLEASNDALSQTIERLQETQEQLVQQEKLASMGQLVAGVAHEINNTVNFVSGALPSLHRCMADVKAVVDGYEEVEKARGSGGLAEKLDALHYIKEEHEFDDMFSTIDLLMENMEEGTRRTTSIIRDLKTFSREDVEKVTLSDLHEVLDSTLHIVDKNLRENIEVRRDYGDIPEVYCLPGRISQVFLNIIHNAMQVMEGSGQLTIQTKSEKDHVYIIFSDTGCGIGEDEMSKIFDPFYTSKEVGKGTGLGLSISYSIIRQHDGMIKAANNEDGGAVFEVVLPVGSTETSDDS